MKAGAAIRDITPKAPIQLCGYPESPISTGTHDPFYIAAFYFADAQTKILYLTADLLFFARARVDKITAEISGKTGVAQENILLAATHTHYGPAPDCDIYNEAFGPELCPEYMENVQRCAVDAAVEAVEHAFEAKLGYGRSRTSVGTGTTRKNMRRIRRCRFSRLRMRQTPSAAF